MAINSTGETGGIPSTIVDAKGDIVTAFTADTPAVLPVGSNDQYLAADSVEATGLKWKSFTTADVSGTVGLTTLNSSTSSTSTTAASTPSAVKEVADAAIQKSTVTAKGDIIVATASGVVAALPSGTNNQLLQIDTSTATGLKWSTVASGATHNYQAFTSSTTWTVPASAKFVDVLVVGGGQGGQGGWQEVNAGGRPGHGGGIVVMKEIWLGNTASVSIVVGAGSNGTAGTNSTTSPASSSPASFSAFGNFAYAGGAGSASTTNIQPGVPGYKGTASITQGTSYILSSDATTTNWAPLMTGFGSAQANFFSSSGTATNTHITFGINSFGLFGGQGGSTAANNTTSFPIRFGGYPGYPQPVNVVPSSLISSDFITGISSIYFTAIGNATAGTAGQGASGTGGAAGPLGFAGGGGSCQVGVNTNGGRGGPGAGGGGSWAAAVNLLGGSGGNAGANTGAGGGGGAHTGQASGTAFGGNGGNGAAGIVIVKWIS